MGLLGDVGAESGGALGRRAQVQTSWEQPVQSCCVSAGLGSVACCRLAQQFGELPLLAVLRQIVACFVAQG